MADNQLMNTSHELILKLIFHMAKIINELKHIQFYCHYSNTQRNSCKWLVAKLNTVQQQVIWC